MHEKKEIEISVDRKSSRNWKSPLQWIWNDDLDCFTNFKEFLVTGYVNWCPIHYFKSYKSMNLLKHSWRKRNWNKSWSKIYQEVKTQLQWIWNDDINCFTSLNKFLVTRYVNSMSNTLFKVFKINESIKTFMKEKK